MAIQQPVGKDFYLRAPGDPNYSDGIFESNDPIENALQQTRMTLLTKKGEVLGEDIGFDAEQYLFQFEGIDTSILENDANSQIAEYVLLSKPFNIKAEAFVLNDIADPYKIGLGLNIKVDGKSAMAAIFDS
jgi:hypothetical protein